MNLSTLVLLCFLFVSSLSEAKIYQSSEVSRLSQPLCGGLQYNDCHDQSGFDEFQVKRTLPKAYRNSKPNR